jgi:TetR/AcrR family tetracycline transcriptional repressor
MGERKATVARRAQAPRNGRASPGRERELTHEELVDATLRLIKRDGLSRLTMRSLAAELGTSAMAPYHYVATKDELLELAAESVLLRITVPDPSTGTWEQRLKQFMRSVFEAVGEHPWIPWFHIEGGQGTPAMDRGRTGVLAILADAGFDDETAALGDALVSDYIVGHLVGRPKVASPSIPYATDDEAFGFAFEVVVRGLRSIVRRPVSRDGRRMPE